MKNLSVSQIPYNSAKGSHYKIPAMDLSGEDAGKDCWRAIDGPYKVVAIFNSSKNGCTYFCPCDRSGSPEIVRLADGSEGYATVKMVHDVSIKQTVGHIYQQNEYIYQEGTAGFADGNHIHLEVAKGLQTTRYVEQASGNQNWLMPSEVNPVNAFYILDSYTTIKRTQGLVFTHTTVTNEGSNKVTELKEGYQLLNYAGQNMHLFKPYADLKLGMMSAAGSEPYKAVQDITKIDCSKSIYAKINANYFEMSRQGELGTHYGVEQSFTNDFAPKQSQWLVYALHNDGSIEITTTDKYWSSKKDVQFACSPAAVFNQDGHRTSDAVGEAKVYTANTQTLLLAFTKGFAFAVVSGRLNLIQCWEWAKTLGAVNMAAMDSGGSSQLIVGGIKKVYTGRAIPNVLCFYKDATTPDDGQTDDKDKKIADLETQVSTLTKRISEAEGYMNSATKALKGE
jgi:hypothetical protein